MSENFGLSPEVITINDISDILFLLGRLFDQMAFSETEVVLKKPECNGTAKLLELLSNRALDLSYDYEKEPETTQPDQ